LALAEVALYLAAQQHIRTDVLLTAAAAADAAGQCEYDSVTEDRQPFAPG
jgi:hypothetical protein